MTRPGFRSARLLALLASGLMLVAPSLSFADTPVGATVVASCGAMNYPPGRAATITQDETGKTCVASSAAIAGSTSNASSGVATNSNNLPAVSYNYGFNGTTWDQLLVDGSKNLKINCAVGCAGGSTSNATSGVATSSTNGATVGYNYGFNGTTWDQLQVDASKNLKVIAATGSTTAVTQATGTNLHAVLDTTSTTAVTQATAANLNATVVGTGTFATQDSNLGLSQGSTTSGQKGPLVMGAVTTGSPTYTTAQTSPLSLDTTGALRVNVTAGSSGNACSSATGSAVPAQGCFMAGGAAAGAGNQTGVTVKAASTTPATTDTSLVTAIADGQDVTLGSKADAANCATTNTQIACIRQLHADATAAIPAGTNLIGKVGIDQTTPGTTNGVQVNAALPAGTNLLGKTGIDQTTPGTTNGVVVNSGPCTGMSVKSFIVAANTTSVAIDASAGSVCGVAVYGVAAATPVWVKLYNLAQGSTTCGTSAVIDRVLGATVSTGNGAVVPLAGGVTYSTAISACVVQGIADNDTTAPAATSYTVSVYYK